MENPSAEHAEVMEKTTTNTADTDSGKEEAPRKGSLYEKHKTIYVRTAKGWWTTWRWVFVWGTQLLFYGLPWLSWGDRQAVLLHLVERKFYIFGLVFWPQDVFYLTVLLIISAYSLFLFTAVAGRLFCGYICPQTVYTEVFMWIERIVEGGHTARLKLDKEAMSARKLKIKLLKHTLWILLAFWTGFTLVGYFTPMSELTTSLTHFSFGGWEFFWIFFYGGFTYLMAGFMREQVCKYMCPYARFQSAMFDRDTLIITYDEKRGEPRGVRKKGEETAKLGDCVDCGICVQVCPVGIDIRKGLQYECIGCGACIDGCDEVMDRLHLPRGLVCYASENSMEQRYGRKGLVAHIARPRILLYSVILLAIISAAVWSLITRIPLRADVIRDRSVLSREVEDGRIENIYILKIMNMQEAPRTFQLSVGGLDGIAISGNTRVSLNPTENRDVTVGVRVSQTAAEQGVHKIYFDVVAEDDEAVAVHEKSTFLMP